MKDPASIITPTDYRRLCELAHETVGIVLGDGKEEMLRARLGRRLRDLNLQSISDYVRYLDSPAGHGELTSFINSITTNKTDFFREAHHFEFIAREWVPALVAKHRTQTVNAIKVWSAACSTGAEPYTLAMVLRDALGANLGSIDVRILASDVDTAVLAQAKSGTYPLDQLRGVPSDLLHKWFLKGVGPKKGLARVHPALREMITFQQINFMDASWPIRSRLDLIVCRNVLIYFDYPTQNRIIRRFHDLLSDQGILMLGHSENTLDADSLFERLGRTIYKRKAQNTARVP